MKYKFDEDDLKDIIKLKTLANNDHKFKRYVYNITEEEQKQYGFDFIGEYSYEPNPSSYNLNTTYRNSVDKCVYIKTKSGWKLFLKDGNDGKSVSMGGGMGFNDVDRLITERLKDYTPGQTSGTSGTFYGLNGILELNTVDTKYTITHSKINYIAMAPIVSLNIPSLDSEMLISTITNRTETSFDLILSQTPPSLGYSISWFIPNTNGGEGTITIVNSENVTIQNSFSNISGTNLTEILNSIDIKLNNINYLENYKTKDYETIYSVPEIMYIGKINQLNYWYIRKVITNLDGTIQASHANISNNNTILDYMSAWNNRNSLTYSNLEDLIFI